MNNRLSTIRLGILGGGQLARMLVLKCHQMGIKPYVLSAHPQDPAPQVTPYFVKGALTSKRDLKKFFQKVDLCVFENEFLDLDVLHAISVSTKTPVHPKPKVLKMLQDRLDQKNLLTKYKIGTAPFVSMSSPKQMLSSASLFPKGMVLKKRRLGYDGKGLLFIENPTDKESIKKATMFLQNPCIVEQIVPFKRELALILVRNRKSQIIELPLVQTFQEKGCCLWVKGPMSHTQFKPLVTQLKTMMNEIDYEGALAFELFETQQGSLWVNELAPRVHNSGHYSLSGLSEDQFSLHIKAVLNMDLADPFAQKGFAMLNLLGVKTPKNWLCPKGMQLHWYGKVKSWPGRKMGHINNVDVSPQKALEGLLDFHKNQL